MIRVLIVNNRLDPALGTGTARKATTIARALEQGGAAVELASFDIGLDTPEARVDLAGLAINRVPCAGERWPVPLVTPATVRRQVERADVLLIVNHWTPINLVYAWAGRAAGRPYVVMPCGALNIFGRSRGFKRVYNAVAGHHMVRNARAWIATTPDEIASFVPYGVRPDQVQVIPNAVDSHEAGDADVSRFRREYGISEPFVLFMGRIATIKGPDLLLDAWSRIADRVPHHLLLAGPAGDASAEMQSFLQQHGARLRARWIGSIDRAAGRGAYAAASVLVVPSRLEAMSLVALEGGLAGCPVIATTTCGFPALAEHGGLIVEPNAAPLAAALSAALAWTRQERDARGQQLRAYIERSHTWTAITPLYFDVLRDAIGTDSSPGPAGCGTPA